MKSIILPVTRCANARIAPDFVPDQQQDKKGGDLHAAGHARILDEWTKYRSSAINTSDISY
jgi:hypothetical protein